MNPNNFRRRLLFDLFKSFLLPILVFSLILSFSHLHLSWYLIPPAHILFIVSWAYTKRTVLDFHQARDAARLGARRIPRVKGKWPGNVDVLLKMLKAFKTAYVVDVYLRIFEEYGCTTLNLYIFWTDQIITMDHEHTKFVLATGFQHFWRGYSQKERMENFLGVGIFNRDDDVWKMHRSMARPFFARERISDFANFEHHTQQTLSLLPPSSPSSTPPPIEAQDLYSRFTIDTASSFLFGPTHTLSTLSSALPSPSHAVMGPKGSLTQDAWGSFTGAFEAAQQIITERTRIGWMWPLFELGGDRTEEHVRVIRKWLDPVVEEAIEEREKRREGGKGEGGEEEEEDKTFLQHLVDSTSDPILIRDQLLSILLASRDTTACVLTFLTYIMSTTPSIATRLRAEVLATVGPDAAPTYDQIRGMKYMRAVLNETLRLFPPVPLNVRESRGEGCVFPKSDATYRSTTSTSKPNSSEKDTPHHPSEDPRPLYMPPRTTIIYLPLLFQRNKALWGADADEFDPERWIDPLRLERFVKNPSIWGAFSMGPRICIGQNYAYNEASYFLTRLMQNFSRFELAGEVQPRASVPPEEWKGEGRQGRQRVEKVWPGAALTLYVKGGLWVRFFRAGEEAS